MIHLTAATPILIATKTVDFRKGIDGFKAVCQNELQCDPQSGTVFVFLNRNKTMIRVLVYDKNGYWLMTKRLSKGRYQNWPLGQSAVLSYQAHTLRQLLTGLIS